MARETGRIVHLWPTSGWPQHKMLRIAVADRRIMQTTLAEVSEDDKIIVDTETTHIFDAAGNDITHMPRPVAMRGTLGLAGDGLVVLNVDSVTEL